MNRWEETHVAERAAKGWSGWDVLCAGMDDYLLPTFGGVLERAAFASEAQRSAGRSLQLLSDAAEMTALEVPGASSEEDFALYQEFNRMKQEKTDAAFAWLVAHYDTVKTLLLPPGRPVFQVLGEALVFFGQYPLHGFPGRGAYEQQGKGNEAYEAWRGDCVRHGAALRDDSPHAVEALTWLAQWHWDIWD